MSTIRAWMIHLAGVFSGPAADADLSAELESHLQLHIDDNVRAGMTPDQARRQAILALGGVEPTKARIRDRRGLPFFDTLRQDVTDAVRGLIRSPGFAATAVLTLALGIGANTAIFSVVNAVLLRPLPFADPGRLVLIFATDARRGDRFDSASYPAYFDWRTQNHSFESLAAFASRSMTVSAGGSTEMAQAKRVTLELFEVLGARPALGRTFRPEEQQAGAGNVVVLSDGFWRRHFGADPAALGQTLRINDELHTVVGVMPAAFHIDQPEDERFYLPQAIDANRGHGFLKVVARLRPGVTLAQARLDMDGIAARLETTYPTHQRGIGVNLVRLPDGLVRDARAGLLTLLGVVGLVLVIACSNVAGLMLARGASRRRELAVRAALGAGRGRIARQLLTESLLIALSGGALGLIAADWIARGLAATLSAQFRVPRADATSTDASVLAFTLLISIATGLLFGVWPALLSASPDLNDALREGGRSATGHRAPRLRNLLVVVEMALALVLLASAGTLLKQFLALRATDPGFESSRVLTVDLFLPQPRFAERHARSTFLESALQRVEALPGVQAAAFVADLPLNGGTDSESFHIVGRPDPEPDRWFSAGFNIASAEYFKTMRIPLRAGRDFQDDDGPDTAGVIVVNETAARRFFPEGSAIGQQIDLPITATRSVRLTVVGVSGDVRHVSLGAPPRPEIFVNSMQSELAWPWLVLAVRAHGDPSSLAGPIKDALRAADPNVPTKRAATLEAVVARSIVEPRIYTFLLGTFAALAVTLAAIGLYGLIAYTVSQRTHELGVRIALGAERSTIVRLVIGQGLRLAIGGAGVGLAGAFAVTRLLAGLVKGAEPHDVTTLTVVTLVMFTAAILACYLPARRAARVDPMTALRAE